MLVIVNMANKLMVILSLVLVAVAVVDVSVAGEVREQEQEQEATVRSDIIIGGDLSLLLSRRGVRGNDSGSEARSHQRHRRHLRPLKLETHKGNNENENENENEDEDEMMMECVLYIKVMKYENNYEKESYSCEFTQEQSKLYGFIPASTGSDVDIDGGGDRASNRDSSSFGNYIMDIVGITKSEIDLKAAVGGGGRTGKETGGGINIMSGGTVLKSKFAYVESSNDEDDDWSMSLYIGQEAGGQEAASSSRAGSGNNGDNNDNLFILETLDEMYDTRHTNYRRRERQRQRQRQRNLADSRPGIIKAFVVRVQGQNGIKIDASVERLQDDFFKDELCLKSQYAACSKDQLTIEPADDYDDDNGTRIEGGIGTINIANLNNVQDYVSVVNSAVGDKYGQQLSGPNFPDLTLVCLPPNLNSDFIAFAFVNGYYSFYKGEYCQYPFIHMHEVGHNFGFGHSMEEEDPYGDRSGYMGNGPPSIVFQDDNPEMCFNAAKNFQLSWYDSQKLSINPLDFPTKSQTFVLTGVGNYDKKAGTTAELITLRLEHTGDNTGTNKGRDYYIGFNSKKSPNKDTLEGANRVLVTEKEGPVNSYGRSNLIGKLKQGNSITLTNYKNTRSEVKITVTSINTGAGTATIRIDVFDPIPCQEDNGKVEFRLEMYTDSFPMETSWTISTVEKPNKSIYSSGEYYLSFTNYNERVCLKTSVKKSKCYVVTIIDSYGDGMSCKGSNDPNCQTGDGFYRGYLVGEGNINALIFEGDVFGSDERQTFCVEPTADITTTTGCVNDSTYAFQNRTKKKFKKYCQRKVRKKPNKFCDKFDKKNRKRVSFYCPLYCKDECK